MRHEFRGKREHGCLCIFGAARRECQCSQDESRQIKSHRWYTEREELANEYYVPWLQDAVVVSRRRVVGKHIHTSHGAANTQKEIRKPILKPPMAARRCSGCQLPQCIAVRRHRRRLSAATGLVAMCPSWIATTAQAATALQWL